MKNYSSSHLDIIKNLLFSIKETFKSSPVCFIVGAAIQLLNTVSYYVILYFSRNIINTLNDSLSNQLPFNESITQISIWVIFERRIFHFADFCELF